MINALCPCRKSRSMEDDATIQTLQDTIARMKQEKEKEYVKYKYLELKQQFLGVRDYYGHQALLSKMWEFGPVDVSALEWDTRCPNVDTTNPLTLILSMCNVDWVYTDKADVVTVYPYNFCSAYDVDLVMSESDCDHIELFLGKKFYTANSLETQKNVYYCIYVLHKLIVAYLDNYEDRHWFHDGLYGNVISDYILPYSVPGRPFFDVPDAFQSFLDKKGSFDDFFSGHSVKNN